ETRELSTRRCLRACAKRGSWCFKGSQQSAVQNAVQQTAILVQKDARRYQSLMKGLLAFARKHGLVAGHLTGIEAISGGQPGPCRVSGAGGNRKARTGRISAENPACPRLVLWPSARRTCASSRSRAA